MGVFEEQSATGWSRIKSMNVDPGMIAPTQDPDSVGVLSYGLPCVPSGDQGREGRFCPGDDPRHR